MHKIRFDEVCKTNKVEIFQRVNKPNSFYSNSLNPQFFEKKMLKHMDYIEVRCSSSKNVRVTKKAGSERKDYLSSDDVIREPITEITSRYHYIQSDVENESDKKIGIFKDKFSIVDTQTKKVLAYYSTVWSRDLKRYCPSPSDKWEISMLKYVFNISDDVELEFILHTSDGTPEK